MSYSSSSPSIAVRKPKGLSKGAACVTCKLRKVRCDAVKPACTACRRSARWRGDNAVECCYVEATPRRKSSKSHHDDLLRQCLRSASGDSTASSSCVSTPSSERSEHPFSSPPSPALLDLESLLAFPIPSFPAITSSTFALPELPPLDGTFASSLDASTKGKASSMDALAYPTDMDLDSLLLDLASSLPLPTWPPALDSSTVVSDPSLPTIGGVASTAPQYASDLVASPSSYLDLDFDLGPCPPLSPSFTASFDSFVAPPPPLDLPLPQGLGFALAETNPPAPSSTRSLPLPRRAARPERIAIPVSDPADPFAAAFGQALAERLCSGAAQLES